MACITEVLLLFVLGGSVEDSEVAGAASFSFAAIMFGQAVRRIATSAVRRSHYAEGPGQNLPFSVENKWRLLALMTVFFGSGFTAPFLIVRHQLLKK
uniref:Cytochrome c oxidase subunit 7C, mitochondrial n=1 Tax=Leptobrachium leishanense TaxID=445787 RepID=A0A8C5P791_9ANUR